MVDAGLLQSIAVFLIITVATIVIAILLSNLVRKFLDSRSVGMGTSIMASKALRYIIIAVGLYYGLSVVLRLDFTALIASLGIITLIIAFSTQQVLQNFIAGVIISLEKPMELEDIVEILPDTGICKVKAINIMNSVFRKEDGKLLYIPNLTLLNSKIINYYYPSPEMAVLVQVGVHYGSDLEKVERVTIEVARDTLKHVAGGVPAFEPFIRYHTFNAYSIDFTVILRGREFTDNYLIKHEFIKRLHKRYAQEGLVIPYPIRAINYDQEKAFSSGGKEGK